MRRKIWTTLGVGLALGVAHGADAAPASDYPNGTLDHALEKMFDGEGGEEGVGLTDLKDGRVSAPALRDDQIVKALGGNTVRSANRLAVHLRADGTVEGWTLKWKPAPAESCAAPRAKGFALDEGQCVASSRIPVRGAWTAKGGRLCLPGVFASPYDFAIPDRRCYAVVLMINSVLVFDEAGKLVRRPMSLMKGDVQGELGG